MNAGFDKTIRLFHIDGKDNAKIQSYYFQDLPIFTAIFNPKGNEVIVTGRRNYFYSLDLDSGNTKRIGRVLGKF
jgi:U3 small nucleolar RNA-associated protein 18